MKNTIDYSYKADYKENYDAYCYGNFDTKILFHDNVASDNSRYELLFGVRNGNGFLAILNLGLVVECTYYASKDYTAESLARTGMLSSKECWHIAMYCEDRVKELNGK